MNTNLTGKGLLDALAASVTDLLSMLLEAIFGSGVNTRLVGDITWADGGVLLCLVLTVLVANRAAASFLRRKTCQAEA